MNRLLKLHHEIRTMALWLVKHGPPQRDGLWFGWGCYPKEASRRFVEWLTENFDLEEQVGVIMIMRDAGIDYSVYVRQDEPVTTEFAAAVRDPLAEAMGGRMGQAHSRRTHSKQPYTGETP